METAKYKDSLQLDDNLKDGLNIDGGNGHHPEPVRITGCIKLGAAYVDLVVSVSDIQRHLWFKIDTGSDRTVISSADAAAIGLAGQTSDGESLDVVDFRGKQVTGVLRESTFYFRPQGTDNENRLISYDADILVVHDEQPESLEPVCSLLGLDLLGHFRLCMDFDSEVVTLDHQATSDHVVLVEEVSETHSNGQEVPRLTRVLTRLNLRRFTQRAESA